MYHFYVAHYFSAYSFLRPMKFVDLTSFTSRLPGGRSTLGISLLAGIFCWIAFKLLKVWWKSSGSSKQVMSLVWATTITWTLVTNVYMPMYDTILVVISLIITAGSLRSVQNYHLNRWFGMICLTVFTSYWVTEE